MSGRLAPLYIVSGAPAAGKSLVSRELVRLGGGIVVMDIDELLEDGTLLGVPIATPEAESVWPAYNRLWRRIIDMPRRAGHSVVFVCPLVPTEFDGATAWLLLDCSDAVRTARLRERGWSWERIEDALADARKYRTIFSTVIDTTDQTPVQAADRVVRWLREFPRGDAVI